MSKKDSEFSIVLKLGDAYKLGETIFSEPLKYIALKELTARGATLKDGVLTYDGIRIKL